MVFLTIIPAFAVNLNATHRSAPNGLVAFFRFDFPVSQNSRDLLSFLIVTAAEGWPGAAGNPPCISPNSLHNGIVRISTAEAVDEFAKKKTAVGSQTRTTVFLFREKKERASIGSANSRSSLREYHNKDRTELQAFFLFAKRILRNDGRADQRSTPRE